MAETPAVLTEMKLTEQLRTLVNGALDRGKPLVLAYVTPEGKPSITFRGSVQAFGEDSLAVWVRDRAAGLATAIRTHPHVTLFYCDDVFAKEKRSMVTFQGRARLDEDPGVARTVYDNSPALERNRDPERKGVAMIIELDSVTGAAPGAQFRMKR